MSRLASRAETFDDFGDTFGDVPTISEVRFDPWLEPIGPGVIRLINSVFERAEQHRPALSRQPRRDAVSRRRSIVGAVVANLVMAEWSAPGTRVSITTANSALTRYDRRDFPKAAVSTLLTELEAVGFLILTRGVHRRFTSVIEATDQLRALIAATGTLGPWEIGVAPGRETIMLRDSPKHVAGHTHRGQLIDYADTNETIQLRTEMTVINDFLARAEITLDGRPVAASHLCRQFQMPASVSVPTFGLHGRLYGGFWINMHREDRHRIGIRGEQPIDLDFTAMFTAIAYALVGQGALTGDPYDDVAGLELTDLNDPQRRASVRGAIKRGLNAMYFRKGPMTRLPTEVKRVLGQGWTARRFTDALRQRHAPIANLFEAGVGLELMYIESKIMVRFLLSLVDLNVPALPIHDGALVACSDRGVALAAMGEASSSVLGVPLPVRAKPLPTSLPQSTNCPPMP